MLDEQEGSFVRSLVEKTGKHRFLPGTEHKTAADTGPRSAWEAKPCSFSGGNNGPIPGCSGYLCARPRSREYGK